MKFRKPEKKSMNQTERKEIITEINEIENGKPIEKTNKIKSWSLKWSVKLIKMKKNKKKKREKRHRLSLPGIKKKGI